MGHRHVIAGSTARSPKAQAPAMQARRRRKPARPRRSPWVPGVVLGLLITLAGVGVIARHRTTEKGYDRLAREVLGTPLVSDTTAPSDSTPQDSDGLSWETLSAQNDEVAAWVRVEGTGISLPVLAPKDGSMSFYLTHDLWKRPSLEGVPFLDHRCSADGVHRLCYGHHLTMGGQFSELQHANEEEAFRSLGTCRWSTPARGTSTLEPLCALRVDQDGTAVQRFSFAHDQELRSWLYGLAAQASVRADAWDQRIARARSAVTLATCASDQPGQRWRTLVVFVEADTAEGAVGTAHPWQAGASAPDGPSREAPHKASLVGRGRREGGGS